MDAPVIGTVWEHHNGTKYQVVDILNSLTERPEKYPVIVAYMNVHTGTKWGRPLSLWYQSMTLIPK